MPSLAERFEDKYTPEPNSGCWLWTAASSRRGYGLIARGGAKTGNIGAHCASYELHVGPIPKGLYVLHRCDNTFCVNPRHLFVGTQVQNIEDCRQKGRMSKGRRHGELVSAGARRGDEHRLSRLTSSKVKEIRARISAGISGKEIARIFGVSRATISRVRNGVSWGHI